LTGIKVFVVKYFPLLSPTTKSPTNGKNQKKDEDIPVEHLMTQHDLSMIEIHPSLDEATTLVQKQPFYFYLDMILLLFGCTCTSSIASSIVSCLFPSHNPSLWPLFFCFFLFFFIFQALIQLLFQNKFSEPEFELSGFTALLTFAILTTFDFFLKISCFFSTSTITAIAQHVNALLMQMSSTFPIPTVSNMSVIVTFILNWFLSFFAMSMVIPAMRFTLSLSKMTLGKSYEKVTQPWIFICSIDFMFPFIIAILFSSGINKFTNNKLVEECLPIIELSEDSGTSPATQICLNASSTTFLQPNTMLLVQFASLLLFFLLKLLVFRKHLQSFMDFSVETSALCMMIPDREKKIFFVTTIAVSSYLPLFRFPDLLCFRNERNI
jgi:hypothetical protein